MDEAGGALGTRLALGTLTAGGELLRAHPHGGRCAQPQSAPAGSWGLSELPVAPTEKALCTHFTQLVPDLHTQRGSSTKMLS